MKTEPKTLYEIFCPENDAGKNYVGEALVAPLRERLRVYFYTRPGAVDAWTKLKEQRIEVHNAKNIEDARQAIVQKVRRVLTESADHIEDIEIEF